MAHGLPGKVFYRELAILIDIMLLGHWLEMKSVMGAILMSISTVIVAINAKLLSLAKQRLAGREAS